MTDATHIEPQKMIAAARKMQDRSFSMSTEQDHLQTNIQPAQVFGSALGQNGIPGEFFLRKVASLEHAWDPTGDWAWFSTVYCPEETFSTASDPPWMPRLFRAWREVIFNRVRESAQVTDELDRLSHAIVQYLEDATDIDLENAGLITDSPSPDEGQERT